MRGLARIFIICTEPATELVLALVTVDLWKGASQALQLASSPGQGQAYDSSYLKALPITEATIARAKIAQIEAATLGSKYIGKEAGVRMWQLSHYGIPPPEGGLGFTD